MRRNKSQGTVLIEQNKALSSQKDDMVAITPFLELFFSKMMVDEFFPSQYILAMSEN